MLILISDQHNLTVGLLFVLCTFIHSIDEFPDKTYYIPLATSILITRIVFYSDLLPMIMEILYAITLIPYETVRSYCNLGVNSEEFSNPVEVKSIDEVNLGMIDLKKITHEEFEMI